MAHDKEDSTLDENGKPEMGQIQSCVLHAAALQDAHSVGSWTCLVHCTSRGSVQWTLLGFPPDLLLLDRVASYAMLSRVEMHGP